MPTASCPITSTLIEGGETTIIPDFVKDFKQRTGLAFRRATSRPLWQKSYYDHILRSEEAILDVAGTSSATWFELDW